MIERVLCLLIGYIFGLFQTGYIYGKFKHIDIRNQGSGNAGTTNALRVLGWQAGLITFLGDAFKCIFAVIAVRLIFGDHLVCLAAFLIVVGLTRYVSVGSLVVVTIYLIEIVFYGQQGGFGVPEGALLEMYAIAALLLASAFFKHRANIKRLLSGTENKLSVGKKK